MKISREWLQTYFEKQLPNALGISDALTFHAFEIESVDPIGKTASSNGAGNSIDWVFDVKVTPNRGHDCLSHRGIVKELSAILTLPLKQDPLRGKAELTPTTDSVAVSIEEPKLCRRYIAGHIRGVNVGPSPEWLRKRLEAIGQRSINNIVDAANYVMFDLGQPLHAFDAGELKKSKNGYAIAVQTAKKGEKMTTLDGEAHTFNDSTLLITDANTKKPIGIAGVKGGKEAGVNEKTTEIILESANFDGVSVRRSAQAQKLRTDASERFQQVISPELAAYGIRAAADLIIELAGGELVGFADEYPPLLPSAEIIISASKVNDVLGRSLAKSDMADVLARLDFPFKAAQGTFTIQVPFERLDLSIPEDIAEEIGRIIGYDKIPSAELSVFSDK